MSDSDDDLPISELINKRKRMEAAAAAAAGASKKKAHVDKGETASSSKPKASSSSSSSTTARSSSAPRSSSSSGNKAADFYSDTKKGFLVQSLLVRWWYAMDWPNANDIGEPPAGFEALDGFPGVFISTRVRCFAV
jgi:hypothetical protein